MRIFLVFLLLINCVNGFGQIRTNKLIPKEKNGDTLFWYKIVNEDAKKLKLKPTINSDDSFRFRFWTNNQIIDIWSNNNKLEGKLTNYTYSYFRFDNNKTNKKRQKAYYQSMPIDSIKSRNVLNLLGSIKQIPTGDSVSGWENGLDGVEYIYEIGTQSSYVFRTYWTPSAQDSKLIEAELIQNFVDSLHSILDLESSYNSFFSKLKSGNYTNNDAYISVKPKPLTAKQIQYQKKMKPYQDYLNSMKDTLANYLNDTLAKIFSHQGDLDCYYDFYLQFSKENKLINVTTYSEFLDKEDRRDFESCRRKILEAFKMIKIDFVHSQIGYTKKLEYSNDVFSISNW